MLRDQLIKQLVQRIITLKNTHKRTQMGHGVLALLQLAVARRELLRPMTPDIRQQVILRRKIIKEGTLGNARRSCNIRYSSHGVAAFNKQLFCYSKNFLFTLLRRFSRPHSAPPY